MRGNSCVRGALVCHHGQESVRFFWGGGLLDHKLYLEKYSTLILIVFNPHCGKFCIYMGDASAEWLFFLLWVERLENLLENQDIILVGDNFLYFHDLDINLVMMQ